MFGIKKQVLKETKLNGDLKQLLETKQNKKNTIKLIGKDKIGLTDKFLENSHKFGIKKYVLRLEN